MRKFAVFSGFLGSGKTSTMMALTKYYTAAHGKAAMISNDLGGKGLADHRLARLQGCNAAEITDECICFCHDVLRNQLELFYADGVELVVSDIPGLVLVHWSMFTMGWSMIILPLLNSLPLRF